MKKVSTRGFTIVELIVTIVVIAIIATVSIVNIKDFILEKRLETEVVSLWNELKSLRPKAMKSETCFHVQFDEAKKSYTIYNDIDDNCIFAENIDSIIGSDLGIDTISFGLPADLSTGPDNTASPSKSIEGNWETSMTVNNDNIGTINSGRLFFNNPSLPNIGFSIQIKENSQIIKLYKWSNSRWYEM